MICNNPVKITETVLRDGQQSLAATRMRITDMLPVLEQLDEVGYYSLEAWGGATFDSCLRYLNEDPWERLRTLKKHLKKTPIQMLLRGQNLLGYSHYADDLVAEFVNRAVDNGVGIIRVFDALNDSRNLEAVIRAGKRAGAHMQGAIGYTISPVHTTESFLKYAQELVDLGVDSICLKDMAGLLTPYVAEHLVRSLKSTVSVPIQIHSHYTSGMASMVYLKAIEAGVDVIDCALSPFAMGSSQPATEAMVATLEGLPRDTGIKKESLYPIADFFRCVKKSLAHDFNLNTAIDIDTKVLTYQVPGGMLSNMLNQLKEQGMGDRFPEVIAEMPRVRAELGFPPLVTPTSQIVGSMASFNVMLGRYEVVPDEVKNLARGKYGRTPAPVDPEILSKILGSEDKIITGRPADDIAPQMESMRVRLIEAGYSNPSVEDVLSYALFPEVSMRFFAANRCK